MTTIRPAEAGDEQTWRAMWETFIQSGPEPCAPEAPDHVWAQVMAPDRDMAMLVAARDDQADDLLGFVLYLPHPYSWSARPVCYLLDLYVRDDARRQGVGEALMMRLAAIGREAGWLKVYWMTQADNEAAHALYGKVAERSPLVRYDMMISDH